MHERTSCSLTGIRRCQSQNCSKPMLALPQLSKDRCWLRRSLQSSVRSGKPLIYMMLIFCASALTRELLISASIVDRTYASAQGSTRTHTEKCDGNFAPRPYRAARVRTVTNTSAVSSDWLDRGQAGLGTARMSCVWLSSDSQGKTSTARAPHRSHTAQRGDSQH